MTSIVDDCAICIDELKKGLICTLNCKHIFHCCCLNRLEQNICPICRTPFPTHDVNKVIDNHYNQISSMISVLYINLAEPLNDYEFDEKMDKDSIRFIVKEKLNEISLKIENLDLQDNNNFSFELDDVYSK